MTTNELFSQDKSYVMQTYGRFPVAIERGEGATLYDPEGKAYIDFASGIGVLSIGTAHPKFVEAVSAQAGKLAHASNLFFTEPGVILAKRLCEKSGMDKVFFSNSGAESNEGMIKLARKYSTDRYDNDRTEIITLVNSFHGRTISTLAATGQDVFHQYFYPFTEGFAHVPANDLDALKAAATDRTCAVMMELVQGEGGVLPLDRGYVKAVESFCKENDLLLLIDEVQTGIGRTGTLFAFQGYGISPDVVSCAKGIGGGLPLGAVLASKTCSDVLGPGTHATTFGANPICTAAGNAVLDVLEDGILESVSEKGAYLRSKIEEMGFATRGMGLMIGIVVEAGTHKETVKKLIEQGLLCITAGKDAIRLLPPLTITKDEMDRGLAILKQVLCGGSK
ncbi:MAG: aspartate aminotransferase family protein [Ruminococcaceae bacterium]|nr:aspartate aminotransferase family protein [Oscillospiraceae bacterium]